MTFFYNSWRNFVRAVAARANELAKNGGELAICPKQTARPELTVKG